MGLGRARQERECGRGEWVGHRGRDPGHVAVNGVDSPPRRHEDGRGDSVGPMGEELGHRARHLGPTCGAAWWPGHDRLETLGSNAVVDQVAEHLYDPADTFGSDLFLVTAGRPRKPGMSRSDLLEVNGQVMASVAETIRNGSPPARG